MTDRRNKGKYEVCTDCGAHLDHGEQCDCREEDSPQDAVYKAEDIYKEKQALVAVEAFGYEERTYSERCVR